MVFEFDGKKYSQASFHQKEWGTLLIAELGLRGDEKVLDLGCGEGFLTEKIAELVPTGQVTGIDGSRGMIQAAQKRKLDNLSFKVMDINNLDLAPEFDVVFSNAVLHWIKDHERLLDNVHRCLKENGFMRLSFAGHGNSSSLIKVLREVMNYPRYQLHFRGFDWPWYMPAAEEYEVLLKKSPFTEYKVWLQNADRYFADSAELVKWIEQPCIVPFLEHLDKSDQKQSFRDSVVNRMIEETSLEGGRCFETFRRINVFARKQV
ncbi:MAG TPA: methyltransferase domain-containing protein [archaeon]|nr:methyltransferase domain-containing protein [archaeon]